MAVVLHEFVIPTVTGVTRSAVVTLQLPTGTVLLGIFAPRGDGARLVARGDTLQPLVPRDFVAVRSDVPLTAAEQLGTYLGSVSGYRTDQGLEVYHIIAL